LGVNGDASGLELRGLQRKAAAAGDVFCGKMHEIRTARRTRMKEMQDVMMMTKKQEQQLLEGRQ
jgi:hypothetical protein